MNKYYVIGNKASKSLSPTIFNYLFKKHKIKATYGFIELNNKNFDKKIKRILKDSCVKGLNITIPFKQKVFDYCGEISPVAKKVKAINTLKLKENKDWSGTNTDIDGFIYPLRKLDLIKKTSIVLGSGGAARSVIQGLINLKLSKITIISRNKDALYELTTNFKDDIKIEGVVDTNTKIESLIQNTDLIVNTTPVGMSGTSNDTELPFGQNIWNSLNSNTIVYDLIYNPSPTPFLKFCEKKGCKTIDGLQMLVAQGAKSLSFWTNGLEIPFEVMYEAIRKYL